MFLMSTAFRISVKSLKSVCVNGSKPAEQGVKARAPGTEPVQSAWTSGKHCKSTGRNCLPEKTLAEPAGDSATYERAFSHVAACESNLLDSIQVNTIQSLSTPFATVTVKTGGRQLKISWDRTGAEGVLSVPISHELIWTDQNTVDVPECLNLKEKNWQASDQPVHQE